MTAPVIPKSALKLGESDMKVTGELSSKTGVIDHLLYNLMPLYHKFQAI